MEKNMIHISEENLQKIVAELEEIKNLSPDDVVKFRIDNLITTISRKIDPSKNEDLGDIIYKKMKEAVTNNPDLHVKLYMLYRNLTAGKISEEEAKEMYETYLQMYPYEPYIY